MNEQLVLIATPRARHDSPVTSREAAAVVACAGGAIELAIADCVRTSPCPLTGEQIAHQLTLESDRWGHGTIETAVTRARRRGLIIPAGFGLTSRGREAAMYRAAP